MITKQTFFILQTFKRQKFERSVVVASWMLIWFVLRYAIFQLFSSELLLVSLCKIFSCMFKIHCFGRNIWMWEHLKISLHWKIWNSSCRLYYCEQNSAQCCRSRLSHLSLSFKENINSNGQETILLILYINVLFTSPKLTSSS